MNSMLSENTRKDLKDLKDQLSILQSTNAETELSVGEIKKQLSGLQSAIAKIEGSMASSWALHSREEYEKAFRDNCKQDIMAFVTKFVVSAVIVLAGAGYLFIKSVVVDVYDSKNKEVISDLQSRYDNLVNLDKKRYEWQRFHNYGSERLHLAEFYLYLPVPESERQKIIKNLLNSAEDRFNEALLSDPRQASTYWELAELKYSYPKQKFNLPELIKEDNAIQNYKRAISLYTEEEISKGWRGDCYLKLGEIYASRARLGGEEKNQNLKIAIKGLQEAKKEYEGSNASTVDRVNEKLIEIDNLLRELMNSKG